MAATGHAAFRVDANPEIGLGHLRRCATLLRRLSADGFVVRLVSRDRFGAAFAPLIGGIPVSRIVSGDEETDAAATLSAVGPAPAGPSWMIVDHYGLGERWERTVREAGHRVLAIDDNRSRAHCADILVSDTDAPFGPELNRAPAGARELLGAKYALIEPDFAYSSDEAPSTGSRKRLLVSYGGSDPTDETSKALEAVRLLRADAAAGGRLGEVDVVVGPANPRSARLLALAESVPGTNMHLAPASLAPFLRRADLFLTAGGNSLVEALAMRKPCLVTTASGNQALMVAQLLEQGAIVSIGDHAGVGPRDVAAAVTAAVADFERLSAGARERALFDHHGARRISEMIQSMSRGMNS